MSAEYERMAWHLMTHHGMTAEGAVETIRLLLSDDPADTAVMKDGIGTLLDGLLTDGSSPENGVTSAQNEGTP